MVIRIKKLFIGETKMYKKFRPDDVIFPFVIGLLIFGLIVMVALQGVA